MPTVHAIDLSHWNTVESFAAVRKSGVVGVIHKATEGTGYFDDTYDDRIQAALDADLKWGAYHFMRPGNMRDQMEWFVKKAKLPPGSRMALDHEDPLVSLDDLCVAVNELNALMDCEIAIYSGHVIKDQLGDRYSATLAACSLWLAQYGNTPSWPSTTWPTYSLWQFTDTGQCPGISGDCDLNTFNGSAEACARWIGPADETVEISRGNVAMELTASGDISISISVNGKPWRPM